jgi:hypothetical protein
VRALAWRDRLRQYRGLPRTAGKLRRLVRDFSFEPLVDGVRRVAAARAEVTA